MSGSSTLVSTLGQLALLMPIQDLQLPPSVLASDRRFCPQIDVPYMLGKRSFGVAHPLPLAANGMPQLPRVLRETTSFVMLDSMLKTEGLFRVNARAITVDILKESYAREQKFITWKEGRNVISSIHRREGHGDVMIEDLARTEGYEIHAATALIKQWYKDLQEPIFPQSSYSALRRVISSHDTKIADSTLKGMLADSNDWSPLSNTAKKIMLMHLLPFLSAVAEYRDWNQMDSHNLAICFAPTLVHGPDPMEDVDMSKIAQNILEHMTRQWKDVLAPEFGMDRAKFEDSLRLPENVKDREDPIEGARGRQSSDENQSHGTIALLHTEDAIVKEERPPLPPRPTRSATNEESIESPLTVRRKPAPPMASLPRYSTVIRETPPTLQHLPYYNTVEVEEDFEPADPSDLPPYGSTLSASRTPSIPHKPPHSIPEDQ